MIMKFLKIFLKYNKKILLMMKNRIDNCFQKFNKNKKLNKNINNLKQKIK